MEMGGTGQCLSVGEQFLVLYFPVTSHLLHAAQPVALGHPPTLGWGEVPNHHPILPLDRPPCSLPDGKKRPGGGGNLEQSMPNPWLGLSQTGDGGCGAWELGHTCS